MAGVNQPDPAEIFLFRTDAPKRSAILADVGQAPNKSV